MRIWNSPVQNRVVAAETVEVAPKMSLRLSPHLASVVRQHPHNRDVIVFAARKARGAEEENIEVLGQLYPQDAYIVSLQLYRAVEGLTSGRVPGPLGNVNYPKPAPPIDPSKVSPREKWQKVIELARQGQRLQPGNSYFDWMLLYALYGTQQDDRARLVLAGAVKKTEYNTFDREAIFNAIAFQRLAQGSPLSPSELLKAQYETYSFSGTKQRQVARWAMESAIADRKAGRHDRAIDTAFRFSKLSQIMQRGGYTYIDYLIAFACESIALQSADERIKNGVSTAVNLRPNSSLAQFHSHPRSLYLYASQQGRRELLPQLDARWTERARWFASTRQVARSLGPAYSMEDVAILAIGERLRSIIARALPSVVLLGIVFWMLSWRYHDEAIASAASGLPAAWTRGAVTGVLLLLLAMGFDAVMIAAGRSSFSGEWRYEYLESGLLQKAPWWVSFGVAGALLCTAVSMAIAWQKRRSGGTSGLKQELYRTFHGAEDGLARFDFGWLLRWVARLTFWLLFLGGLLWLASSRGPGTAELYGLVVPLGVLTSLALHLLTWRRRSHRRQTALLSFRLVAQSMGGFFAIASVLYALSAFALLPKAWQFDRDFEAAMKQGELKMVLTKVGL